MREETSAREAAELRRGDPRGPRSPRGWGLLQALWLLAFYQPVVTEGHLRRRSMELVFVRFSAWQFAGCDRLWAGLVTTLCDHVRRHFGALLLSVFHVVGARPRYASGSSRREWVLKTGACLKLWALLLALAAGLAVLLVALLVPGVKEHRALKVVGSAVASLSGSGLALGALSVLKNLLVSEKRKIERLTDSDRFAGQLGFMSKVRAEVEALVDFLAFMEIFERRRLRVVMEVTSLDLCLPERVAGVLTAVNTLLSDAHAPFIFILALDPGVVVPCLEQTGCMKGLADNGYLFLSRSVSLPFSIPEAGARSRLRCLEAALRTREDLMYGIIAANVERRRRRRDGRKNRRGEAAEPGPEEEEEEEEDDPGWREADSEAAARCIHEAFRCLHDASDALSRYVPTSGAHARRIVNTIPITLRLLLHRAGLAGASSSSSSSSSPGCRSPGCPPGCRPAWGPCPRAAAAWVVLADRWPCRLSWALQCLEDADPAAEGGGDDGRRKLWSVFQEHVAELSALRQPLGNLLSLDGDPEQFGAFLRDDFPFTARQARELLGVTVNLDHSIRRKMGMLRALERLR
ncbi:NKPD1 protein, partial [Piprites chloris]|nr:NKPD1 protein [Piprites chloris]